MGWRTSGHHVLISPNISQLESLLQNGDLDIHFQPIVCLKQKRVIGLEALARPRDMGVGEAFTAARQTGSLLALDRLCRQRALESYAALNALAGAARGSRSGEQALLFLNFEASVIDDGIVGSGAVLRATLAAGLEPHSVVIEINESRVQNSEALIQFVEHHRAAGFLIALDDLGTGHSNLPRIAQLRPHIIKLDRSLIAAIDQDFFKQATVRSLVKLGSGIGALVLAEGVETLEEMDCCAGLGADLFQGYAISRPVAPEALQLEQLDPLLRCASDRLRQQAVAGLQSRRIDSQRLMALAQQGCAELQDRPPTQFPEGLAELVQRAPDVEAAYLIDSRGLQVGETHLGGSYRQARNQLFAPSSDGADHSTKDYFFSLMDAGLSRYTTESYISMATGQLCRTIAVVLPHDSGATYVLCIDVAVRT